MVGFSHSLEQLSMSWSGIQWLKSSATNLAEMIHPRLGMNKEISNALNALSKLYDLDQCEIKSAITYIAAMILPRLVMDGQMYPTPWMIDISVKSNLPLFAWLKWSIPAWAIMAKWTNPLLAPSASIHNNRKLGCSLLRDYLDVMVCAELLVSVTASTRTWEIVN